MDALTGDSAVLFLFLTLLPGFLGLAVYGFLVEGEPQDKFNKIVTAFTLSLLAALTAHIITGAPITPDIIVTKDTPVPSVLAALAGRNLLYSTICAGVLAILAAIVNNHGWLHNLTNRLHISYKTSNGDVWQNVFYRHRGFWLEIQFKDGKTLTGWPKYFSATGKPRELFIAEGIWRFTDNKGDLISVDISGAGVYIADMSNVDSIEILK